MARNWRLRKRRTTRMQQARQRTRPRTRRESLVDVMVGAPAFSIATAVATSAALAQGLRICASRSAIVVRSFERCSCWAAFTFVRLGSLRRFVLKLFLG